MSGLSGNLTSEQIADNLNDDFEFGVNFIIDNNPDAIESNISGLSIPLPQNPSHLQMREVIDSIITDGSNDKAVEQFTEIISVPYLEDAPNYTGGFSDYLQTISPPAQHQAKTGMMIANIVGSIINTAGNIWNSYKQEDIAEIHQEMQTEALAYELEKIERTKILGIPQTVFIAVIVFVMFVVLIVFLSNRK